MDKQVIANGERSVAIDGDVSDSTIITGDVYTRSQIEKLNDYLARAVAAYEARMYQFVARSSALPDQPYKFLYAFEIEDTDIFFGRDRASQELHQTVLRDRLAILHARSGAGKTSLLNAGLSPRLIREGRLPVYVRAYDDPIRAIKQTIAPPSLGPWPDLLSQLTLHEFLGLACQHLSHQTQELVIILDQFEDFFIFWPAREHRQPFVDVLADCYADESLPVRFVIALRKEYYSDLAYFQARIPTVLVNEYWLDTMAREEAREAIASPVTRRGRSVAYEPALLDALLDDLARGGMELPHLQIICARLYETLSPSEATITLASYGGQGRAEGILGSYLNDVLDRLPGRGRVIAKEVLKELVSSEKTRRVLGHDTLAARIEAEESELDGVLDQLVKARLLRQDKVVDEIRYEMAHEYLIEEIKRWFDLGDLTFKQAEELLAREVASWRVHGTLIPRDRLELLYAQRERFRRWDDETWECVLRSALQADFAVEDWTRLAGEVASQPLLEALKESPGKTREPAIRALGTLGDTQAVEPLIAALQDGQVREAAIKTLGALGDPRAVEPLLAVLQDSEQDNVLPGSAALGIPGRPVPPVPGSFGIDLHQKKSPVSHRNLARALGNLGKPAVDPLITALRDQDHNVRGVAAEALGYLGDPRAVEPLIAALQDRNVHVREAAVRALGNLGDLRAVDPLVAVLHQRYRRTREAIAQALDLAPRDDSVRVAAVEALGHFNVPHAIEPLITTLQNKDYRLREAAAKALENIGEPARELLIVALREHGNSHVRQSAATVLGNLSDQRVIEPLCAALRDKHSHVRSAAARALGELEDSNATMPLVIALQDRDHYVRVSAVKALEALGDPRAVKPLTGTLLDKHIDVRLATIQALGKIGDSSAVEPLVASLQDENERVRAAAARALGSFGDIRAVAPLIAILGDQDDDVRMAAIGVLGDLNDSRAVEPLVGVLQDRERAVQYIGRLSHIDARAIAARVLGKLDDPRAVEPLIAVLRQEEALGQQEIALPWDLGSRMWVRGEIARTLGKLGDPRAVEPLTTVLHSKNSDVRRIAAEALEKIGTPEALAALEEWRQHRNE